MRISTLTGLTAFSFVFNIFFAYLYYVLVLGMTAWPIPTISETWTYKPSNFLSRQFVISGAFSLMLIHTAIYYSSKDTKGSSVLFLIAVVGNVSLAIVSAVCMNDTSPECLGSTKYHDEFAVLYFVLIDIWMVGMILTTPRRSNLQLFSCFGSMTSKLPLTGFILPSWLGSVEWVNVAALLLFMVSFVHDNLDKFEIGVIGPSASVPFLTRTVYTSISNAMATITSLGMGFATIGIAFQISASRLEVNQGPVVPTVSDLFVLPPGNSFAHFGGVMGCTLLIIVCFQFYESYSKWTNAPQGALVTSLIAVFSLSMSMCISKLEDIEVHYLFVTIFFTAFQAFSLWIAFWVRENQSVPATLRSWIAVLSLTSLATKYRLAIWDMNDFALYEVADLVAIALYIGSYAWFESETLSKHPFAIYVMERNAPTTDTNLKESLLPV